MKISNMSYNNRDIPDEVGAIKGKCVDLFRAGGQQRFVMTLLTCEFIKHVEVG